MSSTIVGEVCHQFLKVVVQITVLEGNFITFQSVHLNPATLPEWVIHRWHGHVGKNISGWWKRPAGGWQETCDLWSWWVHVKRTMKRLISVAKLITFILYFVDASLTSGICFFLQSPSSLVHSYYHLSFLRRGRRAVWVGGGSRSPSLLSSPQWKNTTRKARWLRWK